MFIAKLWKLSLRIGKFLCFCGRTGHDIHHIGINIIVGGDQQCSFADKCQSVQFLLGAR